MYNSLRIPWDRRNPYFTLDQVQEDHHGKRALAADMGTFSYCWRCSQVEVIDHRPERSAYSLPHSRSSPSARGSSNDACRWLEHGAHRDSEAVLALGGSLAS